MIWDRTTITLLIIGAIALTLAFCGAAPALDLAVGPVLMRLHPAPWFLQEGLASRYAYGRRTACGRRFDPHAFAAAHRTLPCGTWVTVENVATRQVVTVQVTDRGPFVRGRVIDLTPAAAERIGLTERRGVTRVRLEARLKR